MPWDAWQKAREQPVDQSQSEDADWGVFSGKRHKLSSVCALNKVSVNGATEG